MNRTLCSSVFCSSNCTSRIRSRSPSGPSSCWRCININVLWLLKMLIKRKSSLRHSLEIRCQGTNLITKVIGNCDSMRVALFKCPPIKLNYNFMNRVVNLKSTMANRLKGIRLPARRRSANSVKPCRQWLLPVDQTSSWADRGNSEASESSLHTAVIQI